VDLGVLWSADFNLQRVKSWRGLRWKRDVVLGAHLLLDGSERRLQLFRGLGHEQTSTGFVGQPLQDYVTRRPQAFLVHGKRVDLNLAALRGRDHVRQSAQTVRVVAVAEDDNGALHDNAIADPASLLPASMQEVDVREIWDGDLYVLTFRKPN